MIASVPDRAPAPSPHTLEVRILPFEEWPRAKAIEPFASRGLPEDPDSWMILVVERDGAIVGSCSLFTPMHWDCWYISPEEPGASRGVVLRQLLATALEILTQLKIGQVYTGVERTGPANAASLLKRFGFKPAPGRLFVLDVADAAEAFKE
jgi:hypothetical protein